MNFEELYSALPNNQSRWRIKGVIEKLDISSPSEFSNFTKQDLLRTKEVVQEQVGQLEEVLEKQGIYFANHIQHAGLPYDIAILSPKELRVNGQGIKLQNRTPIYTIVSLFVEYSRQPYRLSPTQRYQNVGLAIRRDPSTVRRYLKKAKLI